MKKKIIIISIIVIAAGIGVYFFLQRKQNEPIQWRTAQITKGDVNVQVTATGTIQAVTSVLVGTQVSGTICKLYADFNDHVKSGQIIALIDTSFLYASLLDAKALMEKAQIQADQSKRDFDRQNELFKKDAISRSEYEQSNAAYQSNLSVLNSVKAQYNRARINLNYAKIRSPIDGIVISRNVDIGQTVAASFNTPTLFTVANDLTKMQIMADIDETDIGEVMVGEKVNFTVDAYPNLKFNGEVTQVRLQPIVIQNVVNYSAVINTSNPELKLKPGMTANITINVDSHKNVFRIPSVALHFIPTGELTSFIKDVDTIAKKEKHRFILSIRSGLANTEVMAKNESLNEGDSTFIWIKSGDQIDVIKIKVGISDGTFTEVTGELRSGDEIIISGARATKEDKAKQNPFMPKMPAPRRS